MLKFIKGHMTSITDVSIYPVTAFVIFLGIFTIATLLIMTTSRKMIKHMEELPLDNDQTGF